MPHIDREVERERDKCGVWKLENPNTLIDRLDLDDYG
jgi:hypothetical protein